MYLMAIPDAVWRMEDCGGCPAQAGGDLAKWVAVNVGKRPEHTVLTVTSGAGDKVEGISPISELRTWVAEALQGQHIVDPEAMSAGGAVGPPGGQDLP